MLRLAQFPTICCANMSGAVHDWALGRKITPMQRPEAGIWVLASECLESEKPK